jgi:hypothetical protein
MSDYARNCTACGHQISCNMYGMGLCDNCGFDDKAIQDYNVHRAAEWRREKGIRYKKAGPAAIDRNTVAQILAYLQRVADANQAGPNAPMRVVRDMIESKFFS